MVHVRKKASLPVMPFTGMGESISESGESEMTAKGTFTVKLTPQDSDDAAHPVPGRMSIDKQFQGDLAGSSKGQMLAAQTGVKGSAGYVAMEMVTGTLAGRSGTFCLQHSGTMNRGEPQLSVTVVPDSGTEELTGLSGRMAIVIANGSHSYEFEYLIAAP
jgi:hypothetical protein